MGAVRITSSESKVQWKPFWLATQQYPKNDWLGCNFPFTLTYAHGPHLAFFKYTFIILSLGKVKLRF